MKILKKIRALFLVPFFVIGCNALPVLAIGGPLPPKGYEAALKPLTLDGIQYSIITNFNFQSQIKTQIKSEIATKKYEEIALSEIMTQLSQSVEQAMKPMISSLNDIQFSDGQDTVGSLLLIRDAIAKKVAQLDSELPSTAIYLTVAVVPWKFDHFAEKEKHGDVTDMSKAEFSDLLSKYILAMKSVATGLSGNLSTEKVPAYLIGAVFNLKIQKKASEVQMQVALGLNAQTTPMPMPTEQLTIEQVVIPEPYTAELAPTALINLSQKLVDGPPLPTVKVQFGELTTLVKNDNDELYQFDLNQGYLCRYAYAVPRIEGYETYTGLVPVQLYLKELNFNLNTLKVDATTVSVGALSVGCLNFDFVNDIFTGEANQAISKPILDIKELGYFLIHSSPQDLQNYIETQRARSPLIPKQ
jgi:hypothetical protein